MRAACLSHDPSASRPDSFRRRPLLWWRPALVLLIVLLRLPAAAGVIDQVPAEPIEALSISDPLIDAAFRQSVELVFNERFKECMALLDDLSRQRPNHPAPDFMRAAAYQSWMNTYRTNRFTEVMDRHLDEAIEKGRAMLLATHDDPWLHVFIGAAQGFRALNRFRRGQWMSALTNITSAVSNLKTALTAAPHVYDAYMGIGTYNYWRTARSQFVSNVAFWMTDRREIGIPQMQFVVTHGVYSVHETRYNLIAALIDRGLPDKALSFVDDNIRQKGKAGLIDLYYRGRAMQTKARWAEVISDFGKLSDRLANAPLASAGYRAECRYRMVLGYYHLNRANDALAAATEALSLAQRRNPENEIDSSFEKFSQILHEIEALREKLDHLMMVESRTHDRPAAAVPLN
jgi:tetratricopeptide (TPR) repeat protein